MTVIRSRIIPTILLTFLAASVASAGTLSGTVINRTTGKPEPNIPLTLMSPTQGMRDLGSAKSDAQGRFTATNDTIGTAPILIRATFHDVSFNTFAPPGRPEVEVEIYDISGNPKTVTVPSHIVIFQPEGDKLVGAEEYTIDNSSQPPVAFFRTEGNFEFAIPDNAKLGQVSTSTSMGMPVTQASIDHGKGQFAIAYPFRPGQTNVRLSYELPYSGNAATLKLPAYAGVKLLVVVPPGVTVTADGLASAGQEQGMMVYTHEPLAAKAVLTLSVSGLGAPPSDAQGSTDNGQEGNSRTGGQEVIAAPSRIDDIKWFLFAGIAALFAMGALLLSRKQVVVAEGEEEAVPPVAPAKPPKHAKPKKTTAAASVTAAGNSQNHSAAVDQHVSMSMESLKDEVFRLELRRQAGTISAEDYNREKTRIDKLLRDLVKG
jgi:hypothetical protein